MIDHLVTEAEYEFSQDCTTLTMQHQLGTKLKGVAIHVHDGSRDGKTGELEFTPGNSHQLKGEFSIHRQYTVTIPLKGYKANLMGFLDVDNDTHHCTVELLKQKENGWERVEEPKYDLKLVY